MSKLSVIPGWAAAALAAAAIVAGAAYFVVQAGELGREAKSDPTPQRMIARNPVPALRGVQTISEATQVFRAATPPPGKQPSERQIMDVARDGGPWYLMYHAQPATPPAAGRQWLAVCDGETGQPLKTLADSLEREDYAFNQALFSPGCRYVLTGSATGWLRIWDVKTGQEVAGWRNSARPIRCLAWSPDGKSIAVGGYEDAPRAAISIRIYDVATRQKSLTILGHEDEITALLFDPAAPRLLSASADETVRIWDTATAKELARLEGHTEAITAIALSPDRKLLATAGRDNCICFWDMDTNALRGRIVGHIELADGRHGVLSVAFTQDGSRLLTTGEDNAARFWDVASGQCIAVANRAGQRAWLLPDDQHWLSGESGMVYYWTLPRDIEPPRGGPATREIVYETARIAPINGIPSRLAILDRNRVMLATADGSRCYCLCSDIQERYEVSRATFPKRQVLAFSADGHTAAVGGWGAELCLMDATSGAEVRKLPGHMRPAQLGAFTGDGKSLVTAEAFIDRSRPFIINPLDMYALPAAFASLTDAAERQTNLYVWNAADGKLLRKLPLGFQAITSLCAIPGTPRVMVALADWDRSRSTYSNYGSEIQIWDVVAGKLVRKLTYSGPSCPAHSMAVSVDGRRAVSGLADGSFILWNLDIGYSMVRISNAHANRGGTQAVTAVAFSPDGRHLATGGADTDVRSWVIGEAGNVIPGVRFDRHRRPITAILILDDGRMLSGSADGTVRLWPAR